MELLRAKSEDEKVIFRKLFHTEVYEKMVKELGNKPKIIKVCLSAVLDKADIGTGNKEWIQITPE